ncbi:NAD(P)/FAD-dependent oxidoreductase [Candidatus Sumerlaeota bacterium]|nr:NAD(P)/FAD-dependent oxidoreductase [Candidatus Sumerlaeota bacterium]
MKYDCVVIGSGVSGLTAGLILSRFGRRVAVVEQKPHSAPLIRRFRRGGVWCDSGFHYCGGLRPNEGFTPLLRFLGIQDSLGLTAMNPDAYDVLVTPGGGGQLRFPIGLERVRDTLSGAFPDSRKAVDAYVDRVDAIHRQMPFSASGAAPDEIFLHENSIRTIGSFLREVGAQEEMLRSLDGYGTVLHGTNIDETSPYVHAMVVGSYYYAAHTFKKGGDSLVDAFERRLKEAEVDVLCGRRAVAIRADDQRRVVGVEIEDTDDGGRDFIACDLCVSTIHPKILVEILPRESVSPRFFKWVERMEETFPPFVVHLDLDPIPEVLRNANMALLHEEERGEDDPFLAILGTSLPGEDSERKSLCLLRKAPRYRPTDPCLGRAMARDFGAGADPCRDWRRSASYAEFKEAMTQSMLDDFEGVFPETRGKYKVLAACSPCTFDRRAGAWRGSIYGVKHLAGQRNLGPVGPLRGLFLAGQNTSVASGVMGAITSSFLAAAQILGWETVWSEVRACRDTE